MKYSYSNEQMRRADADTIASGTSARELMERAGGALADIVARAMQQRGAQEALFVCGGGNNGGDGFVAARILSERGLRAEVLCLAQHYSVECAWAREAFSGECHARMVRRRYPLIVDCLFGTGLSRAPEGESAALIELINGADYVVSADIPSGLSENGIAYSPCVRADETVCMGQMKNCLLMADGADLAGEITVAKIGISSKEEGAQVWEDGDARAWFPPRRSNVHKGNFGSACILAGDAAMSGAAFLAASACLKSGVGYTRLEVGERLFPHAVGRLPACILQEFVAISGEILASNSIAVGMGAGISERLYAILDELGQTYSGTLVMDADALNTIAEYGMCMGKERSCSLVMTPHPKEFARLIGKDVKEVLAHAVEYAKAYARENGLVLVLKNNRSIITDGERVAINPTGSPALAKGGSGDVLTGLLAGTCGRGVPPFEAACVSSYLLGRAGEIAASEMGEYSPDATDIIRCIPKAIMSLRA